MYIGVSPAGMENAGRLFFKALGAAASTLLIRVYQRGERLYTALEARGYVEK